EHSKLTPSWRNYETRLGSTPRSSAARIHSRNSFRLRLLRRGRTLLLSRRPRLAFHEPPDGRDRRLHHYLRARRVPCLLVPLDGEITPGKAVAASPGCGEAPR